MALDPNTFPSQFIETNGIRMHVKFAGPEDGAPVVLLHGFPEFWYGWHKQMTPLAEAGYRVIVPDQRGYNLTDKPDGIAAYNVDLLVNDIVGLIDALGYEQVRLVGHDWGAIIAWYIALKRPDKLSQLVIANVPHPDVFSRFLRTSPQQFLRSWYVYFFQLPEIPERIISANDFEVGIAPLKESEFSEEELAHYREAWSKPGALTAMLNWYRAYFRYPPEKPESWRVSVPTLMLWGMRDFALTYDMVDPSINMCDDGSVVMFREATHFVQHDRAEQVANYLIAFFAGERIELV